MTRFVLDCSVSAAWCLADETSAASDRYLGLLEEGEASVPSLWVAEMANVLVTAERQRRMTMEDAKLALELLDRLPIRIEQADSKTMARVHGLAIEHRLTAYDASYLDLALTQGLPLVSFDRDVRRAAEAAGVRLL